MSLITLNNDARLEDLIAALRPFAADDGSGSPVLDTADLRTKSDVDRVLEAKSKVKEQYNELKSRLSAYTDAFGDDPKRASEAKTKLAAFTEIFGDDPAAAGEQFESLKSKGGDNAAELLETKRQLRAVTKERDKIKADFDGQASRIAELDRRELSDRKNAKFENDILRNLDPKYDRQKARIIWGDLRERVRFKDDDPDEFEDFEQGKSVDQAIHDRLDLYGAYVQIQGGKGNPGNASPRNGGEDRGMFADAAAQIKFN